MFYFPPSLFSKDWHKIFLELINFDGLKLSFMYVDLRFGYVESDTDLSTVFKLKHFWKNKIFILPKIRVKSTKIG